MLTKLLPLILAILLADSSAFAKGGLSGSGGGGGVICFADEALAVEASRHLDANRPLPDALLGAGRMQVLEEWEMDATSQPIGRKLDLETWQDYLAGIEGVLRAEFPVAMFRLDQVGDWSQLRSWKNVESLALYEDAEPMEPIGSKCRRVQLALRHSQGNNALGEGPTKNLPTVQVNYVQRYFDRLSDEGKAMLVFHEKIYMLGQSMGHPESDYIRAFTRIFFGSSTPRMRGQAGTIVGDRAFFQIKRALIDAFGDYPFFFVEAFPYAGGAPFTPQHQFATFLTMEMSARARMSACLASGEAQGCLERTMSPRMREAELNSEQAFLYFSFYGMEKSLMQVNADQLMDPAGRDPRTFAKAMKVACHLVNVYQQSPALGSIPAKAKSYCDQFSSMSQGNKLN